MVIWKGRGRAMALVALVLVLHAAASLWSARRESATYDEIESILGVYKDA